MKVLLSIKPEFVEKIFSGEKMFEYRKSAFKDRSVTTVMVYATKPVGRIVGEFSVVDILTGSPEELWRKTCNHSGITREFYEDYFEGRRTACAIKIGTLFPYDEPIAPSEMFDNFVAPQSYMYVRSKTERTQLELFDADSSHRALAM